MILLLRDLRKNNIGGREKTLQVGDYFANNVSEILNCLKIIGCYINFKGYIVYKSLSLYDSFHGSFNSILTFWINVLSSSPFEKNSSSYN